MAPLINDVEPSLALAVISSSAYPLVLLDGDLKVVAASRSFCAAFGIDPSRTSGVSLFGLGAGEWDVPQLRTLLRATVDGAARVDGYEMDLSRPGMDVRQLVLSPTLLDYGSDKHIRVLLAIADVTDVRAHERLRESLLAEMAVLLRELQHRVANSLQIIASILMMSARRVQSEETRAHLHAAHGRVMSMAAVQQQLATSNLADVDVKRYFTQLCEGLGASMIRDREKVSIEVRADSGNVDPSMSVSLGLIVTELVINSLKHAFPNGTGKIIVSFRREEGASWTLSVGDDGSGMPLAPSRAKAGLGTSLVEALASQLHARIEVTSASPGTLVSIIHAGPRSGAAETAQQVAV